MTTKQGDLALLNEPVAQELLHSTLPAHLAYTWMDGTPRLVPIWFHWNGTELVFAGPTGAPKLKALHDGSAVAVSIDSTTMPYKVLMMRGVVRIDTVPGVAPEYELASVRVLGDEAGSAWNAQMRALVSETTRIFLKPTWVGLLDFETRFPSAVERAFARARVPA